MSAHEIQPTATSNNFIRDIIAAQIEHGEHTGDVVTRFPPEPNGFLHIGHAQSICVNFGLADYFDGFCRLRFDDTNPEKEEQRYIDQIQEDVHWLGFEWEGSIRFSSDYFETLYEYALHLIENGDAYVDELSSEQARAYRGDWNTPGTNSPYRSRTPAENLERFEMMRAGQFGEGQAALRAKIDMAAGNMNLRDPIIYRVRHATHHQTGDRWCIYPSYDFAHGQSDAIEGVTHSICTLEFADHRPLYDWFIDHLPVPARPVQYEFGRLNISFTVTSKRRLRRLIDEGFVNGWDDPRMPTLSGIRRRGYTPAAIRDFCEAVGVTRTDGMVDVAQLEHAVRDDLNKNAPRAMCVMDPLKIVLTNFGADEVETITARGHPDRDDLPTRQLPLTREIVIEHADFRESANKKYKRLVLGKKVRLRNAYVIQADEVVKNDAGEIIEVHCRYDPDTLGELPADGVKPKGVIHWVSASHGARATVREYDRLFATDKPGRDTEDFVEDLNPNALTVHHNCHIEPGLARAVPETRVQFERIGYFVADRYDHTPEAPVFNQTVALRDSWAGKTA